MTEQRRLQLIRHLQSAERTYSYLTTVALGESRAAAARAVLEDCRETIAWVRALKTEDAR